MGYVTVWDLVLCCLVVTCAAFNPPSLSGKVASRVIAKVGKNTKLLCPFDSDPSLTQWKKNGQALNPGWDRFKVSRDGHLRIRNVELTDAGLYTCVATNGFGSMSINQTVIVLDEENHVFQEADKLIKQSPSEDIYREAAAPVFEELSKMRDLMILKKPTGSTLKLTCKAIGNPQPQVQWFKGSKLLKERRAQPTLKIHKVTGDDSGKYTCVASNRLGQTNFTYNVSVIDEISQVPRLIAPHPMNKTVNVGDSVSFQCFIESVVEPEVQWLKRVDNLDSNTNPNITLLHYNKQSLMVLKGAGILQAKPDGSYLNKLNIKSVKLQDAGMFVCLATNRQGFVSRHAYLHVVEGGTGGYNNNYYPKQMNNDFSNYYPNQGQGQSSNSSPSDDQNSSTHSSDDEEDTNLPLLIGLPACGLLIIILITVFLLQRNNRCRRSNTNTKVPRTPVPPVEREAYYYSNCQQQHLQQSINPLLMSRDKLPKTPTPSVDMTGSEFSSVSRSHHPPLPPSHHLYYSHNNHNFGY